MKLNKEKNLSKQSMEEELVEHQARNMNGIELNP